MKLYKKILILFVLTITNILNAQIIYVSGNLPASQEDKFVQIIDNLIKRYSKITFYVNGINNSNKIKVKKLTDFNNLKEKINNSSEISLSELTAIVKLKNKKKSARITYLFEYPENQQFGLPLAFLDDLPKILYNIKNEIIILRLNNNEIQIENPSFHDNMKLSVATNDFQGLIKTKVELKSVQYRINNDVWRDIYIEKNKSGKYEFWENITFTKTGKNIVYMRITDNDNNVKSFVFNNLDYTQILLDERKCRFVSPNKFGTNVEKRIFSQRSDAIVFWFKIETVADLNGLSFVRCDRNKNPIVSIPLGSTYAGEKPKFVWSGEKYYCFGLTREELKLGSSDCEYDAKGLELLSYIYLQENSNLTKGEIIPVVFSTISSEQSIRQRISRAECGL